MSKKNCSVEWCTRSAHARGYCNMHYQQIWRDGRITVRKAFSSLPGEEWRDIQDFDGLYQVSNFGRVRSYKNSRGVREKIPKLLKEHLNQNRYNQLSFSYRGKRRVLLVHRLVAQAFIPNPEGKPFINHKDGVRNNNNVGNLEWCTPSENARHSYDILKQPLPPGNPKPIRCVETGVVYKSAVDAQKATGIQKTNIGKVALARKTAGKRLGHTNLTAGGFHWEFVRQ